MPDYFTESAKNVLNLCRLNKKKIVPKFCLVKYLFARLKSKIVRPGTDAYIRLSSDD